MNAKTIKNLMQAEKNRMNQEHINENVDFLASLRDMDIQSNTTKMADAYIENMKNRTIYRDSFGNYKTRTYEELGIDPSFGTSKYDKLARNEYEMRNIEDVRSREQGSFTRLGSGLIRAGANMLTTTATPFMFIPGAMFGFANMKESNQRTGREENKWQSFWSGFIDNAIMNTFADFNDFVATKVAPIYTTDESREMGPLQKMFTPKSGFWAEDFVSNLGFTVGAMVGGKLNARMWDAIGKNKFENSAKKIIAEKLGLGDNLDEFVNRVAATEKPSEKMLEVFDEVLKYRNRKNFRSTTIGIIGGAVTEAETEALQAKRQMVDNGLAGLDEFYNTKNPAAKMEYNQELREGKIRNDMTFDEFLAMKKETGAKQLEYRANEVMRHVFGYETALLTATNAMLWRDWYDVSYRNGVNKLDESLGFVKINKENPLQSTYSKKIPKQISSYLSYFLTEGGEEWAQHGLSAGFEDYYGAKLNDDYSALRLQLNPKYKEHVLTIGEGIMSGLGGMASKEGLTEMFVGGLTGVLGLPSSKYTKAQRKAQKISVFNPKAYRMEGGLWSAYRNNRDQKNNSKEFVANLQKSFAEGTTLKGIIDDYAEALAAQHIELGAKMADDKKKALDARRDQFVKALDVYTKLGIRKQVEDHLDVLSNLDALQENEKNIILQNAFDFVKTNKESQPSKAQLKKLQDNIETFAKHQKALMTVYEDFENRLVELANFTSDNNLTAAEKHIFISMVKSDTIRLEDLKGRIHMLMGELSENKSGLFKTSETQEQLPDDIAGIVKWLENNFKSIKMLYNLPYDTTDSNGSTETFLQARESLKRDIMHRILKEKASIDAQKLAGKYARDLIDLYIMNEDASRTAKRISEPLNAILKTAKEIEKRIQDIEKKQEEAGVTKILDDLDKFMNEITGKAFDDSATATNFITFRKHLDDLRNRDENAFWKYVNDSFERIGNKKSLKNPKRAWYMLQYTYNQYKIDALESFATLKQFSQIFDLLSLTMPYKIKQTIDALLLSPDIQEAAKQELRNFKLTYEKKPWYEKNGTDLLTTTPQTQPATQAAQSPGQGNGDAGADPIIKDNGEGKPIIDGTMIIPKETPISSTLKMTMYNQIRKYADMLTGTGITFDESKIGDGILTVMNPYGLLGGVTKEHVKSLPMARWTFPEELEDTTVEYIYDFYNNKLTIKAYKKQNNTVVDFFKEPIEISITDFISIFSGNYSKAYGGFLSPFDKYNVNKPKLNHEEEFTLELTAHVLLALTEINPSYAGKTLKDALYFIFPCMNMGQDSTFNKNVLWSGLFTKLEAVSNEAVRKNLSDISNAMLDIYKMSANQGKGKEETDKAGTADGTKPQPRKFTERGYSENEQKALAELNNKFQNGDGTLNTMANLLEIKNIPESQAKFEESLADLGYEPIHDDAGRITGLKYIENNFPTSSSLDQAKGYFPTGYGITFMGESYNVTKTDDTGRIVEAVSQDGTKSLKRNANRWYPETKAKVEEENNARYERQTQKSTVQIPEYNTTIPDASGGISTNSIATKPNSITSKLYNAHPLWCQYVSGIMELAYESIGTGKIKEGDDITFTKVYISDTTEIGKKLLSDKNERQWLNDSRDYNGYFVIVARNQNGDICGVISPSTYSNTHSELYDAIIKSGYDETNGIFNLTTKVGNVSNARERTMRLEWNAVHSLDEVDQFDNFTIVGKFGNRFMVTNDPTEEVKSQKERLYNPNTRNGGWALNSGQLYFLPKNSSGKAIPSDTSSAILAATITVDSSKNNIEKVLEQFVYGIDTTDNSEERQNNLYKRINNSFFIGHDYKISITISSDNTVTFGVLKATKDAGGNVSYEQVEKFTPEENTLFSVDELGIQENDPEAVQKIAAFLSSIGAKIAYSAASFQNETNLLTDEGVSLRWMYDNKMLKTSAVANRTSNAHVLLDIELPGDNKAKTSEKPAEQPVATPAKTPVKIQEKLQSNAGLDNSYKVSYSGQGVDVYSNEKTVVIRTSNVDTLKNAVKDEAFKNKIKELVANGRTFSIQTPDKGGTTYKDRTGASTRNLIENILQEDETPPTQEQHQTTTPEPETIKASEIDMMLDQKIREVFEASGIAESEFDNLITQLRTTPSIDENYGIDETTAKMIHEALNGDDDNKEQAISCL